MKPGRYSSVRLFIRILVVRIKTGFKSWLWIEAFIIYLLLFIVLNIRGLGIGTGRYFEVCSSKHNYHHKSWIQHKTNLVF